MTALVNGLATTDPNETRWSGRMPRGAPKNTEKITLVVVSPGPKHRVWVAEGSAWEC
jgi:hypothetical protein